MSTSFVAVRHGLSGSGQVLLLNRASKPVRKAECLRLATLCDLPGHSLCEVACEVAEQVIVLRGKVSTYYEKQLAQELVRKHRIGWRIDNRIEVQYEAE